ncbi:uncharacterized protein TM35_000091900 [Trypanosoma theileri]|uniref:Uncharacterized protein n=1 Tax=Trypanosoma theileri TaxID=67003 RepID=A0A1X0P147_9TRYP|nr:uncharacterized protein TM35_000091900 [Trypanosoma theileri]ORC90140.1 hypothetical protein TM35_000091900 [Trypanosoma theileri]
MSTSFDETSGFTSALPVVHPLDAEMKKLEDAATALACEFGTLVASYKDHAVRVECATIQSSEALLKSTVFLEDQLRSAIMSANGVLDGMVGMSAAVTGLENLLGDVRKVAQDVTLVENALLVAEKEALGQHDLSEE